MAIENNPFSQKTLSEIKGEVKDLKAQTQTLSTQEVLTSITELKSTMDAMINALKGAGDAGEKEHQGQILLQATVRELIAKTETIQEQNEKIADAIVTIADMIKDSHQKTPAIPTAPKPPMPAMPRPPINPLPRGRLQPLTPTPAPGPSMSPAAQRPPIPGMTPAPMPGMPTPPKPAKKKKFGLF